MKIGTKCRVINDSSEFFQPGEIVVVLEDNSIAPYCTRLQDYIAGKILCEYDASKYNSLAESELEVCDSQIHSASHDRLNNNYKIITLCGSTKFKDEFMRIEKDLTLKGNIVISVGCFGHAGDVFTPEQKIMLDDMHKRKIDMADEIYVIDVDGYIGENTKSEIEYAKEHGKKVNYLVHPLIGKEIRTRKNEIHTITEVIDFAEDTFGQGNFAVITEDGSYLYECEIEILSSDYSKEDIDFSHSENETER